MKKTKLLLPLVLILALTIPACANDRGNNTVINTTGQITPTTQSQPPDRDQVSTEKASVAYEDIKLTFEDAFNIYTDKYPNTKVKEVELYQNYGEYLYEVEGYDGKKEYKIKINSVSQEIIEEKVENDDDNQGELTKDHVEKVEGIISKALKEAGEGAIIKEVTLKNQNGRVEVEVEIDGQGLGDMEYKYDMDGTLLELD